MTEGMVYSGSIPGEPRERGEGLGVSFTGGLVRQPSTPGRASPVDQVRCMAHRRAVLACEVGAFGATVDGVTDDTVAIQRAIDYAALRRP